MAMRTRSSAKVPHSDEMLGVAQHRIECEGHRRYRIRFAPATGCIEFFRQAHPTLEPREAIRPTDRAPMIRQPEAGTNEFMEWRWAFFQPGRL
jgi:hypothetical protein